MMHPSSAEVLIELRGATPNVMTAHCVPSYHGYIYRNLLVHYLSGRLISLPCIQCLVVCWALCMQDRHESESSKQVI
jgi:hypothetical protein